MDIAPYGTWSSPITTDLLVEDVVRPAFPTIAGDSVYWVEGRPSEAGRYALVRRDADGSSRDVLPATFSVRTLVHEYGGRCYVVDGGTVYAVDFADQRIHRADGGGEPEPITPEPPAPRAWRYADLAVLPGGRHLVCVRERHDEVEVVNDLALVATGGGSAPVELAGGHDFFAAPTVDAGGRRIAWIAWDHPNMPWDGTLLYLAELGEDRQLHDVRVVAGGATESVVDPQFGPDGRLHYVSDRSGWWNLYAHDGAAGEPLAPLEGEFAYPLWQLGQRGYGFLADGSIVARWQAGGRDHLGVVASGGVVEVPTPYRAINHLDVAGGRVVALAGSGTVAPQIASIAMPSGDVEVLRSARAEGVDAAYLSEPVPVDPPLPAGGTTHALYYPPRSPDHAAPGGELPPLIVASHGGPTSAFAGVLDYEVQFFTSRGFAYVEVNYGGSTGYGRDYRDRLRGRWGVVDLEDCVRTAEWLAEQGLADRRRLLVTGGSAGGYTTLCAATFSDAFAAGASHFGVADLAALARDTHKFESRYLDSLVGPWPQAQAVYEERSPIFHTDRLRTPLILLQGLEDAVVPPAQAEVMAAALREKGVPFAYVTFEGEQHGFRQAANIRRATEAELSFYAQVLGFQPAGEIEPVAVENAAALAGRAADG